MKTAFFNLTEDTYTGFELKPALEQSELRRYLFALVVNDIESFYSKHSGILQKLKGIIFVPGNKRHTEKAGDNLRVFYFTPEMKSNLFLMAELHLNILEENIKLKSDYDLLKIDSERTMVQYNRLQGFYESVQQKARQDIQYQNKWTIGALLKLIKFRNTGLLQSSINEFPETVISFFNDKYFEFKGAALMINCAINPEIVVSCGDVSDVIDSNNSRITEVNWIAVYPLVCGNRCEHLLIASDNKNYHFKEYENSFFLLFTEIVTAAYNEKLNEHALIIAKNEAESANRMKTQFMANMNHELRNPLNGILGMIGLLQSSGLNKLQMQQASLLEFSAQSLVRIINDLLDFSSIEKGHFKLSREAFYSSELMQKTITLFKIPAGNKGITLTFIDNAKTESRIEGDPNRVQQIIINFITNSIKYSEHGSIILQQDIIEESDSDIVYKYSVSDNGIGIPPEKLQTIFTEFVQLEDTYTKSQQGLGLGLAIAKSLSGMMNGRIEVNSIYGEGSTFSVTIPFKKLDSGIEVFDADIYKINRSVKTLKILLAEDDLINLFFLETAFKNMGHLTDKANNGVDVLKLLEKESYDIIFMDIGMPVMNGLECITKIRNRNINTPAIAISGYTSENDVMNFISSGFNQVMSKPVEISNLLAIVASITNRK